MCERPIGSCVCVCERVREREQKPDGPVRILRLECLDCGYLAVLITTESSFVSLNISFSLMAPNVSVHHQADAAWQNVNPADPHVT